MERSDEEGSIGSAGDGSPLSAKGDSSLTWSPLPAARAAFAGGALAVASTVLLFFHLAGRSGLLVGWGFAFASVALAVASVALGARPTLPPHARQLRSWAPLGAAGFLVSGAGLLADLADWPMLLSEVMAVLAVAAWWAMVGGNVLRTDNGAGADAGSPGRAFGYLSFVFAALGVIAVGAHLLVAVPAGAAPVRMAYVLWGPWGLMLARHVSRQSTLV